jgi:hypothetical protein
MRPIASRRGGVAEVSKQRVGDVTMRVDKSRHHDRVGGVDHFGITNPNAGAHLGDLVAVDEHISLGEIGPVEGEDTPATKESLGATH